MKKIDFSNIPRYWSKEAICLGDYEMKQYKLTYIPLTLYPRRGSRGIWYSSVTPTFYHNYLAMRDTARNEMNLIRKLNNNTTSLLICQFKMRSKRKRRCVIPRNTLSLLFTFKRNVPLYGNNTRWHTFDLTHLFHR
jgi:hypothetical protein